MSIIHNYHSAFSWFNHHCPLHTTANTLICFSWIMCSTLEMNPKFKILNACCMFCKWTQPLCISSLQTAFLPPVQCFQHFIAFSRDVHYIHLADPRERGKTNHQPSKDATHFLPRQVVKAWWCLNKRRAVKICWFFSKMRKLSTFLFPLSCAVESSNLLW